jgi:hypothetical protein
MDIGIQTEGSKGKLAHKVAVMTGRPKGSERRSTARWRPKWLWLS